MTSDENTNVQIDPPPKRLKPSNAGTGAVIFEPSWGGKDEHIQYKKKCFLQHKREECNRNRAKITLLMRKARK